MSIRYAVLQDAQAIVALLVDAITVSCSLDHHNDQAILKKWLSNKTVASVSQLSDGKTIYLNIQATNKIRQL